MVFKHVPNTFSKFSKRKRCPRPVPTQVKCKNPGRGIARDMNLTLPKHPKLSLLINTYIISIAMLLGMRSKANGA
jgi:hypothetical protein